MSDIRVGIVCEGKTDFYLISKIVQLHFANPVVVTLLQPELSEINSCGPLGGGWGGVYKWCRSIAKQSSNSQLPLMNHDLIIIHLDADVTECNYEDYGISPSEYQSFRQLPANFTCPPPSNAANYLAAALIQWLGKNDLPNSWVVCIPSKSIEAWVVACKYSDAFLHDDSLLECNKRLENWLAQRPIQDGDRFIKSGKKHAKTYRNFADKMTQEDWNKIQDICIQAKQFQRELSATTVCSTFP